MKEIYWLIVLGNLHIVIVTIFVTLVLIGVASLLMYAFSESYETKEREVLSRFTMKVYMAIICTSIVLCFTPSKEDMLAIYGIGGTIDYIQGSEKAKELPDKVVDALTEYLDNIKDQDDESK